MVQGYCLHKVIKATESYKSDVFVYRKYIKPFLYKEFRVNFDSKQIAYENWYNSTQVLKLQFGLTQISDDNLYSHFNNQ